MPRTQTLVQLNSELLRLLDERAAREGVSRSRLIRDALEAYLEDERQADIGRRMVEGYTKMPQDTDDDLSRFVEANTREAWRDLDW